MTADAFPKARERLEDFIETFNRMSNQTVDLFEKTLSVYQAASLPEAQRRVHDLIESSLVALRGNAQSALNMNAKIMALRSAQQQAGMAEAGVASSRVTSGFINPPDLSSLFNPEGFRGGVVGLRSYEDEVLNWDVAIEVAPERPSGTILVTLEYAGRGAPLPMEDPWD